MLVLYLLKYSILQYRFDKNYHLASGQGIRNLHHFSQCLSTPYNRNYSTCIQIPSISGMNTFNIQSFTEKSTVSFKGNTAFHVKILGFFPKPGFIFFNIGRSELCTKSKQTEGNQVLGKSVLMCQWMQEQENSVTFKTQILSSA